MGKRFEFIDNLYAYGMLLVVLGHAGLIEISDCPALSRWIYGFHMPLFFGIAGFLFVNSEPETLSGLVVKKSGRLLLPLFILTSAVYIPKALMSRYAVHPLDASLEGYLGSFLYPFRNPIILFWFLSVLFFIYIVGWFSLKICNRTSWKWLALALVSAVLWVIIPFVELLGVSEILYFFPYFCLGVVIRLKLECIQKLLKRYGMTTRPLTLFAITTAIYTALLYIFPVSFPVGKYIVAFAGIIAAIAFIWLLQSHGHDFFPCLRPYTYAIYLLQWFPMVAVRIICWQHLHWSGYIVSILMFATGVFIPVWTAVMMDRAPFPAPLSRFLKLCLGM